MARLANSRKQIMETPDENQASKLPRAQIHTWNHIFSFINTISLKCAVDLGIPDIIHKYGQPMPLPKLIASLPIHPSKTHFVCRLMSLLVHSGILSHQKVAEDDDPEDGYALNDASKLLLMNNPLSVTPLLLTVLDPIIMKPFFFLSSWLKNDSPTPFDMVHGMNLWEYAANEPQLNQTFNDAMANDAQLVTSVVIETCKDKFEGLESLVDVGGGTGTLAKAIAETFPQMDCTVLDLPHVIAGLQGSKNLKYIAGDMFEEIPPAEAILLKCILHNWNDEECVKILKRCKEAITGQGKGKLIVMDMVMENDTGDYKSIETQLFSDMIMMMMVTGRERNQKEWANLFFSAGFKDYKVTPALGVRCIIEVYP